MCKTVETKAEKVRMAEVKSEREKERKREEMRRKRIEK